MEIPIGNIVTAMATVLAVVIANRLTYTRSSKERIWDLRRQAYGVIVSEIAAIERINDVVEVMMSDPHGYFESKHRTRHSEKIATHWKAASDRFASDYLVLSDEFIKLFEGLETETNSEDPNQNWLDEQETFIEAIKIARVKLTMQARTEVSRTQASWSTRFWPLR